MLAALGFKISYITLLFIISCALSVEQYAPPSSSLYVAEDPHITKKVTVINRQLGENGKETSERKKREATTVPPQTVDRNISTWTSHLNDSHQQLMVHWVGEGSNVIICLARDSTSRVKDLSPSALYISYDYGKNFTNKTESFHLSDSPDSGYAQLDKFFNHPKYPEFCVFVDSTNKKLYYTQDNGRTIIRSDLNFHPSELAFDEDIPNRYVILDKVDSTRNLYMTFDGGKNFKLIQNYVKTFFWSSGVGYPKAFYVERWKPGGNSTVLTANDPSNMVNAQELFADAKDFQIKGDFMFATKQSKENSLDLYISHQRGPFFKANFQTELDLHKFHIADVTDKRIFVSVMHTENLANLYVSEINRNFTQYNFVLSLEQVLCYFPDGNWKDSWLEDVTEDPFTDLYRVEGLKGIYIVSKVNFKSLSFNIEPEHLISLITFDHGVTWSPIVPPSEDENG
nr:sortilin-related receptor isoform X2 [Danaus plexippus plexippus]